MLYKEGAKLGEISPEDFGGYGDLSAELDAITTEAEVQALFDLRDDAASVAKVGWFAPKTAGPLFNNPTEQRLDQQKADSGAFDPKHVDQATPERDQAADPGVASLVPGARADLAPDIPGQK